MQKLQVQPDNTLKDIETGNIKPCGFIWDKKQCTRECGYYNESKKDSETGKIKCFCLEKVMGFVTR